MGIDAAHFNELSIKIGYARQLRKQMLEEGRAWCENANDFRSLDGRQANRIMAAVERMMARNNPSAIRQLLNSDLMRVVQLANLAMCSLILERDEMLMKFLLRDNEITQELNEAVLKGETGVFNEEHKGEGERGASTADVVELRTPATEGNTHGEG